MPAAPGGNIVPLVLVEPTRPDGRRPVTVVQFMVGATGAALGRDGVDGRDPSFSNMANNPVETVEAEAEVMVLEYGLRRDSGGPGRWRGGAGQMVSFRVLRDGCQLLARGLERMRFPPWGACGGHASQLTRVVLNMGTARERDLGKLDMVDVERGDVVTALMSGAGGYGDPMQRDPQRVLDDVRRDLVSVAAAARDYGVAVVDARVDLAGTAALRAAPRGHGNGYDFGDERAAWEAVFDDPHMAALEAHLASVPASERQRRRHAVFRKLEPRLMTPATQQRHELRALFAHPDQVRARLDALLRETSD
jgi:N-methylhydantoinase B